MMLHGDAAGGAGSVSSSSHDSLGELAAAQAVVGAAPAAEPELSELEQRKVVVLGVPWQTDDLTLQQHFRQFGPVEEAQIMREKYTGKSRGFGFVTFRHMADAARAVASEHAIDGRKCEAKFALPEGKVGSARTTRIFVARIPASVSDVHFRAYFEQFGICQDCYMPKDPSKQGHRGIGFVTYASPESVELVMSQTHILNGNEIAIDRATPKEKGVLLPGRLSMSQPNLALSGGGGSAHGGAAYGLLRPPSAASPNSLSNSLLMAGRQGSHAALPLGSIGSSGLLGSPPGQQLLQSNGSAHGGSYHGGSYGGGSYHGGSGGSYHGGSSGYQSGSYHGGSYHGGQSASGSYHGGQLSGGGDGSYHGGNAYGGGLSMGSGMGGGLAGFGSAAVNIANANLAALQQQAAALQQQLNSSALGSSLDTSSPSQLISLLSANSAAAAAGGGMGGAGRYGGQPGASSASSQGDLSTFLGQQQDPAVHGGWLRSTLPPPPGGSLTGSGNLLGPASARAGPRIFIGKLNKETSEQDVKEHFQRFGFVLDVYLPRDKNNKREHRGFGFVTFETEAAIQRVVAHGPHHIRGSIVAIDAAVPRQEEVVLALDSGLAASAALAAGADRETAEALHAMEVLSLEGSGRGRALLRPNLELSSHPSGQLSTRASGGWKSARNVLTAVSTTAKFATLRDLVGTDSFIDPPRLRMVKHLGEGAFAKVQLAELYPEGETPTAGQGSKEVRGVREVAVKTLRRELLEDAEQVQLFVKEVQLMRKLRHRNIVEFMGCSWQPASVDASGASTPREMYFCQEYCAGGSLGDIVRKQMINPFKRMYSDADAVRWCLQVAQALQYLHGSRPVVIHRDLKLENVMLTSENVASADAKLGDFGLARLTAAGEKEKITRLNKLLSQPKGNWDAATRNSSKKLDSLLDRMLSNTTVRSDRTAPTIGELSAPSFLSSGASWGAISTREMTGRTGSFGYMAPEVSREQQYNAQADIFSLAMCMYCLCCRTIPTLQIMLNGDESDLELYAAKVAEGYRPPLLPSLPGSVKKAIEECWKGDPGLRPTAREVVEKLQAICNSGELSTECSSSGGKPAGGCCTVM
ncbi:Dual specificity kinase shkE isoform B [Micractinium conductrix]|uniref:Dual specificity kinase shkE isoform B n=1 Tax=Micractinium conductrix TaxID=554055 RepID=A0A2P6VC31_9CHLO|nr:Dual specificity kinase shkE isoform B [Micractinium conductrix]|eukprot:PSC71652.1 Dual specificity kinase shkE isoform B [Micractinium conductrix]